MFDMLSILHWRKGSRGLREEDHKQIIEMWL